MKDKKELVMSDELLRVLEINKGLVEGLTSRITELENKMNTLERWALVNNDESDYITMREIKTLILYEILNCKNDVQLIRILNRVKEQKEQNE